MQHLLCSICTVQIQPRKNVLVDRAEYPAFALGNMRWIICLERSNTTTAIDHGVGNGDLSDVRF